VKGRERGTGNGEWKNVPASTHVVLRDIACSCRTDTLRGASARSCATHIPRSPFPVSRSQAGYTLIEVIVAFAVLALGLVLLLGTLSGSTRQIRWSNDAGRAALHAQSLLDQAGIGEVLQPGRREGELEDGRYRWTLDVQPYRRARAAQPVDLGEPQLMHVALTVQWGDDPRQRLRLQTLRLVAPDPTQGMALP
jgi:general secretion pathway protein I